MVFTGEPEESEELKDEFVVGDELLVFICGRGDGVLVETGVELLFGWCCCCGICEVCWLLVFWVFGLCAKIESIENGLSEEAAAAAAATAWLKLGKRLAILAARVGLNDFEILSFETFCAIAAAAA